MKTILVLFNELQNWKRDTSPSGELQCHLGCLRGEIEGFVKVI